MGSSPGGLTTTGGLAAPGLPPPGLVAPPVGSLPPGLLPPPVGVSGSLAAALAASAKPPTTAIPIRILLVLFMGCPLPAERSRLHLDGHRRPAPSHWGPRDAPMATVERAPAAAGAGTRRRAGSR